MATLIKERHGAYAAPHSAMAGAVPEGGPAQEFAHVLVSKSGIPVALLGKEGVRSTLDAVRIGRMYRCRGLEFQRAFLTSVGAGQVPHQRIEQYRLSTPDRYRQEEQCARSLVFVAEPGPVTSSS
ncbi:hypothetical protein ABZ419_27820 [Streptomyces cinnamoneus]|uniref:hypothetical protein n=1 Tax=Streptomyces cinnamoneus TaxID=53446 RepID=UPI0033C55165